MAVRAVAKNVRVSPYKARLVTRLVQGKKARDALGLLQFLPSPVAREVARVIKSAMANAENNLLMDPDDLRITHIDASDGPRLRRMNPRARGRADQIKKRTSHISVTVDEEAS